MSAALLKYVNTGATTGAVNFPQVEYLGANPRIPTFTNVPGAARHQPHRVASTPTSASCSRPTPIRVPIMDLDHDVSEDVRAAVAALDTNIKTRILY